MLRYGDLKNQIGTKGIRPFLYCRACGIEASGNAGDYWGQKGTEPIYCCNCGENMVLATKKTVYTIIRG